MYQWAGLGNRTHIHVPVTGNDSHRILRTSFYKVRNNFKNLSQKIAMRSLICSRICHRSINLPALAREESLSAMYGTKENTLSIINNTLLLVPSGGKVSRIFCALCSLY